MTPRAVCVRLGIVSMILTCVERHRHTQTVDGDDVRLVHDVM
jgi:hypothetical protein